MTALRPIPYLIYGKQSTLNNLCKSYELQLLNSVSYTAMKVTFQENKITRSKFNHEVKDLYSEKYKTLRKKKVNGKIHRSHGKLN